MMKLNSDDDAKVKNSIPKGNDIEDHQEQFLPKSPFTPVLSDVVMTPRQNSHSSSKNMNEGSSISSLRSPPSRPALVSPIPPLVFDRYESNSPRKSYHNLNKPLPSIPDMEMEICSDFERKNGSTESTFPRNFKILKKEEKTDRSCSNNLELHEYNHDKNDVRMVVENESKKSIAGDECKVDSQVHPEDYRSSKGDVVKDTETTEERDDMEKAASILCHLKSSHVPPSFSLGTLMIVENMMSYSNKNISRGSDNSRNSINDLGGTHSFLEGKIQTSQYMENPHGYQCVRSKIDKNVIKHREHPNRLSLPQDSQELNSLHCFVRSHLLELFVVPGQLKTSPTEVNVEGSEEDEKNDFRTFHEEINVGGDNTNDYGYSKIGIENNGLCSMRLFPGRVGLRCVHCGHIPRKAIFGKASMSTFYPKSLGDLYRSVCTWQRVHFRACRHIPSSVRETYWSLKDSDRSRGKTKYWVRSARQMGLVDSEGIDGRGGICFV